MPMPRSRHNNRWPAAGLALILSLQPMLWSDTVFAGETVSFSLDVMPILQSRCVECHSPGGQGYQASGLDLRSYAGLMKGTRHGPIVTPGNPLTSNLLVLVDGRADRSIRMPHNRRPLLSQQRDILRDWVRQGARDN